MSDRKGFSKKGILETDFSGIEKTGLCKWGASCLEIFFMKFSQNQTEHVF